MINEINIIEVNLKRSNEYDGQSEIKFIATFIDFLQNIEGKTYGLKLKNSDEVVLVKSHTTTMKEMEKINGITIKCEIK